MIDTEVSNQLSPNQTTGPMPAEIEQWITNRFAAELQRSHDSIDKDQAIPSLGIDSVQILCVMTQIEDWGGFRFPDNPLEHCSTIAELARDVADRVQKKAE